MRTDGHLDSSPRIAKPAGFAVTNRDSLAFSSRAVYMALIDALRKLIVYPSLLRNVRARWNQAFGTS